MQPQIVLNWGAIGAGVLAGMVFGFLWYGPIFGRAWAACVGIDFKKPEPAGMKRAMFLQILGLFLVTYVLAHANQVWRPSVWGIADQDGPAYIYGFFGAFFTWIGFYVPLQLNKVAWENRPWKLFFINAPHDFLKLLMISMILSYWR